MRYLVLALFLSACAAPLDLTPVGTTLISASNSYEHIESAVQTFCAPPVPETFVKPCADVAAYAPALTGSLGELIQLYTTFNNAAKDAQAASADAGVP